jgi:hypothetical protein
MKLLKGFLFYRGIYFVLSIVNLGLYFRSLFVIELTPLILGLGAYFLILIYFNFINIKELVKGNYGGRVIYAEKILSTCRILMNLIMMLPVIPLITLSPIGIVFWKPTMHKLLTTSGLPANWEFILVCLILFVIEMIYFFILKNLEVKKEITN